MTTDCPSPSYPLSTLSLSPSCSPSPCQPSFLSLSSLSSSLPLFFSSPDLISFTSAFFSVSDLLILPRLNRLIRGIADSDTVWRQRLHPALAIARPPALNNKQLAIMYARMGYSHIKPEVRDGACVDQHTDECDESAIIRSSSDFLSTLSALSSGRVAKFSCKQQYIALTQCSHHAHTKCFHLLAPSPPLPLPTAQAHFAHSRVLRYPSPPHPTHPAPVNSFPLCSGCTQQLAVTVKHYYDYQGEWAGQFTITPLSIVRVSVHEVDVRYSHIGGYEGVDHRRFEIARVVGGDGSAEWGVVRMLGYRSGIYAMSSAENVKRCPRLDYSVLRERQKEQLRRRERKRKAAEHRRNKPSGSCHPINAANTAFLTTML